MISAVEGAQGSEVPGCSGAVESASLLMELSILAGQVLIDGEGEKDQYKAVMEAGNAWFDAVGYAEQGFTMGARDLG